MTEEQMGWLEQLRSGGLVPKGMAAVRLQREQRQPHYRDCLLCYLDGRLRFERYCYGEAAGLVFGVWLEGITDQGGLLYQGPFGIEVRQEDLPRSLEMQGPGALQLDGKPWRWCVAATLRDDPKNGYSRLKVLLNRRKRRPASQA